MTTIDEELAALLSTEAVPGVDHLQEAARLLYGSYAGAAMLDARPVAPPDPSLAAKLKRREYKQTYRQSEAHKLYVKSSKHIQSTRSYNRAVVDQRNDGLRVVKDYTELWQLVRVMQKVQPWKHIGDQVWKNLVLDHADEFPVSLRGFIQEKLTFKFPVGTAGSAGSASEQSGEQVVRSGSSGLSGSNPVRAPPVFCGGLTRALSIMKKDMDDGKNLRMVMLSRMSLEDVLAVERFLHVMPDRACTKRVQAKDVESWREHLPAVLFQEENREMGVVLVRRMYNHLKHGEPMFKEHKRRGPVGPVAAAQEPVLPAPIRTHLSIADLLNSEDEAPRMLSVSDMMLDRPIYQSEFFSEAGSDSV